MGKTMLICINSMTFEIHTPHDTSIETRLDPNLSFKPTAWTLTEQDDGDGLALDYKS